MKTWMGMLLAAVVGGGVALLGVNFLKDDGLPVAPGDARETGNAASRLVSSNPPPKAALAPIAIPRRPIFQRTGIVLPKPAIAKPVATVRILRSRPSWPRRVVFSPGVRRDRDCGSTGRHSQRRRIEKTSISPARF